ncbi:MAG TPA: histidine kinase [Solirubrobacteraceae bacterium]|jgi:signal transduction histidine kinase
MAADPSRSGRIAAELHDLVAHQVSVLAIQVRAARALAPRDPAGAAVALAAVRALAAEALADLVRLRRVL